MKYNPPAWSEDNLTFIYNRPLSLYGAIKSLKKSCLFAVLQNRFIYFMFVYKCNMHFAETVGNKTNRL